MELFYHIIGPDNHEITWWQMGVRAVIIFIAAIFMLRYGDQRIFGKSSAFDIVLGIILGSVLSRAITGNSPFLPTIFASFLLVVLHNLLAILSFHYTSFGRFVKGRKIDIIINGQLQENNMRKTKITQNDIREACRKNKIDGLENVKDAFLERSGQISLIPFSAPKK